MQASRLSSFIQNNPRWWTVPAFFVAYLLGAGLGGWLSVDGRFTTFWPNSGLYFAVLLLVPTRRWWIFIATAVAANLAYDVVLEQRPLWSGFGFALANTLEATVGAALARHWLGRTDARLESLADHAKAGAAVALVGAPLGALVGGWTIAMVYAAELAETWATWWISDALGAVLVAPLVLAFAGMRRPPAAREIAEGLALVLLLTLAARWFSGGSTWAMPSAALLLFNLWAAVRLGVPGVAISTAVLSFVSVRHAQLIALASPPGQLDALDLVRDVQAFVATAALLAYGFAIVLQERRLDQLRAEKEAAARNRADRRNAEEALRLRKAQLDFTLAATGVGLWLNTMPLGRLNWDARTRELFFVGEQEEPTAELFFSRLHPDDREPTRRAVEAAVRDRTLYQIEHRAVDPVSGQVRWVRSMGQASYAEDGTPVRFDGINYDVTDRKREEQQRRLSEERFQRLAASMPQIVFTADPAGRVTYTNEFALQFAGVQDLGGDRWLSGIHPDDRDRTRRRWEEGIAAGKAFEFKNRYLRHDGTYRWLLCRTFPNTDDQGNIVEWVGACADIDDLMHMQQELQESARRKDEFLATLAHELRNPLAPVRHGLEVLKRAQGNEQASAAARAMMERQVAQMTRLIDELMDLSRISRGQVVLKNERLELTDALRNALEMIRPELDAQGHELLVEWPAGPVPVHGDATRLAQVFANLLHNAVRYTARGGQIVVSTRTVDGKAEVVVADNGMGIPPEMLRRIFEMFTQVNTRLERSQGGLGIGLNIVDRLVHMHGGRVEAQSAGPGMGSRFVVRLPLAAQEPAAPEVVAPAEPATTRTRRRVLVADDNDDAATSLAMLLELMGHEVRVVHDGLAAVATGETFRPDVIVLDIGMPQLNGYEACRRIRGRPWATGTLVIAATGWGQEQDRRRSQEAGFDAHLTKPLDPEALEQLIDAHRPVTA